MPKRVISQYEGSRPDELHVGAVQRGHGLDLAAAHLLAEEDRHRVRDRVVGVHQVEPLLADHLRDLGRQRQRVGRVLEERVGHHRHAVEGEPVDDAQPRRELGADHVHLVAAPGERDAQFGGDDARTAEGRVADDGEAQLPAAARAADGHSRSPKSNWRGSVTGSGALATSPSPNGRPISAP